MKKNQPKKNFSHGHHHGQIYFTLLPNDNEETRKEATIY